MWTTEDLKTGLVMEYIKEKRTRNTEAPPANKKIVLQTAGRQTDLMTSQLEYAAS